jgi:hypothetical protein
VWKWISFGRKGDTKKLLERNFTENVDYKIEKYLFCGDRRKKDSRGRPQESIKLTVLCFNLKEEYFRIIITNK